MASGILSVLDDVGALMDDVALASKVATRKTAGILGDDLAVNAEKATGFLASRELPVLWAISKGSLINKVIIVPVALILTAFLPAAIKVILVLGAFYLAYEAAEKIVEFFFHRRKAEEVIEEAIHVRDSEKSKIKSAIATDFILSVEIVIIALGAVLEETLVIQIITVSIVALIATVGVYGLVALIVRMDDIGHRMIKRSNDQGLRAKIGHLLVKALPYIIKVIGVIGTIALLLVSGGIFVHNFSFLHNDTFSRWPTILVEFLAGLIAGLILVVLMKLGKRIFRKKTID